MTLRFRLTIAVCLMVTGITAIATANSQPPVNLSWGQLALRGYDAVTYWTSGQPTQGSTSFEHRWNGAMWRFSSAANRDEFAREPERYAPAFGGYCAYAVSRGYTADGDPNAWRIVDGRLYLNYSKRVQRLWEEDVPGNIAKGRMNWRGVLAK
jgi:YHS domain-containing protein